MTSTCVGLTWWINIEAGAALLAALGGAVSYLHVKNARGRWDGGFESGEMEGYKGGCVGDVSVELCGEYVGGRLLSFSARPGTNRVDWSLAVACFSSRVCKITLIRPGAGRKTRLFSRAAVPYRIL